MERESNPDCIPWYMHIRLLASGSDDYNIQIWNVLEGKSLACMQTGHVGNIFSVKVMYMYTVTSDDTEVVCTIFW